MGDRRATRRHPLLLILDVHGTLVDRRAGAGHTAGVSRGPPDLVLHRRAYFYRPYLAAFLDHVFAHFRVGIWSSALPRTVYPVVGRLLGPKLDVARCAFDDGIGPETRRCRAGETAATTTTDSMIRETEKKQWADLERAAPEDRFDWMGKGSSSSLEETLQRLRMVRDAAGQSPKGGHREGEDHHRETTTSYPLQFLWTRRRCYVRRRSGLLDEPGRSPHKPLAVKDMSQLWPGSASRPSRTYQHHPVGMLQKMAQGANETARWLEGGPPAALPPFLYDPTHLPDMPRFGPSKTLLLDDSSFKFGLQPCNGLVVPEYRVERDPYGTDTV
ncbi:MAG: NIF family HAD-type phosphatase, partial [Nitrososphaerales archaeon]